MMRARDLRAFDFEKILALLKPLAVSEPARRGLEALTPSIDADEVRDRLRATAELVELRAHSGSIPIGEFADQSALFATAAREGSMLDGSALVQVRDFVLAARHAEAFLRSRSERYPHVSALVQDLVAPKELADALLKALDDGGGLLDDASRELKRLRTRLRDERQDLENRLGRLLDSSGMQPFLADHLVTVRNSRFVLPLKINYAERLDGIVQDRSVSGETLFVEPMWAVELNNRLVMLEREAEAEERQILMHLTALVRGYVRDLRLTFNALVALDALNARAIFAEKYQCVEPEIVDQGMQLHGARHPLLVASGREVVPIDVLIGPDQHGIVISGPNTGGKTVALKTIGLFCLMAQAGLLVPAQQGSKLRMFRSIFADIGDDQSIEADLSTFSAHIANLSEILRLLEEPALVVLDEPGAGTDPAEGAALTIGLIDYLAARGVLLAIATHSTAVKLYAYGQAALEAAAVDFDPEKLEPRFRLKPHTIGQSYGLAVARRLGLPQEIIDAAQASRPQGSTDLENALERLEAERAQLVRHGERMRDQERIREEQLRHSLAEAQRASEQALKEREKKRAEMDDLLSDLRRDGARLLGEIKTRSKSRRDLTEFVNATEQQIESVVPAEAQPEAASQEPFKVGDQVELAGAGVRGELLVLEAERAVVGRGGLKIEVAPARLRHAVAEKRPPQKTPSITVDFDRSETAELNLIGMRAPDALRKLEEFLDHAYLTSQTEVRVVHGLGSGALRRAIHDYLSGSPYCASFHEAQPHSGGAGATIVELTG
jgi:DNA mismatch repair protein MutS2